jgi:hypothetical protein
MVVFLELKFHGKKGCGHVSNIVFKKFSRKASVFLL